MNKELSLLLKKLRRQKYPKLEIMKKLEEGPKELDNMKLEDMTKDDVYLRYVFCGNDQELKRPEIAKLLIKHGYIIDTNPTLKCFVKFYEDIDYQYL